MRPLRVSVVSWRKSHLVSATLVIFLAAAGAYAGQLPAGGKLDGTSTASIGADFIPPDAAVAAPATTRAVTAQTPGAAASVLGRRGGLRRATGGVRAAAAGRRSPPPAAGSRQGALRQTDVDYSLLGDDDILPGCRPAEGVICADNDVVGILDAETAEIEGLDEAFALASLAPKASASLTGTSQLDAVFDTASTETVAETNGGAGLTLGTEAFSADTTTTETLTSASADASRPDRGLALPESVSLGVGETAVEGLYEWRTFVPRYTYVAGQNFGSPVGLSIVADG